MNSNMKFRDPKTGVVLKDMAAARFAFCAMKCRDCKLSCWQNKEKTRCDIYCHNHRAEAAYLMGYEVVDEEENRDRDERMGSMNGKQASALLRIARYFGEEKQICKLIEELGEATSAASEVLMRLTYQEYEGKEMTITDCLEHLAAELADVRNVADQVILLCGLGHEYKAARKAGIKKTLRYIDEQEGGAT